MKRARDEPSLTRRLEHRPVLLAGLALVVALGAATGMADLAGFAATRAALEGIAPAWLAPALGARVLAYLGYTIAHHRVMSASEESRIEVDTAARVVAFGAGATSLKGGFSIDARALRGAGASAPHARAHVTALAMFEYAVLASAAWVCALLLIGTPGAQGQVVWPWVIGVPAGVALATVGYLALSRRTSGRGGVRRGRLRSVLEGGEILAAQSRRPARAALATGGMALYWAAEICALWAALRAVGVTCSPLVAILGFATGYVLTPRGLPLAGAGIAEVLLPFALHWLGVPLPSAVVAAFAAELTRLLVSLPFALATHGEVQALVETAA